MVDFNQKWANTLKSPVIAVQQHPNCDLFCKQPKRREHLQISQVRKCCAVMYGLFGCTDVTRMYRCYDRPACFLLLAGSKICIQLKPHTLKNAFRQPDRQQLQSWLKQVCTTPISSDMLLHRAYVSDAQFEPHRALFLCDNHPSEQVSLLSIEAT